MNEAHVKSVVDVVSLTALLGVLTDYLPAVSSAFTCVWMLIRILETDTVKRLRERWRRD